MTSTMNLQPRGHANRQRRRDRARLALAAALILALPGVCLAAVSGDTPARLEGEAALGVERGRNSVLFIDRAVADYPWLLGAAADGVEVFLLDAEQEGLAQMVSALSGRSGIEALHLITHGESGRLRLGTSVLDRDTLDADAAALAAIGQALSPDGDILLYGCNVAAGARGEAFVAALAQATGADIAASSNLTGAADLGGDWLLEARSGAVEASGLWQQTPPGFHQTLALSQNFDGLPVGQSGATSAVYGDFTFSANGSANIAIADGDTLIAGPGDHVLRFDSNWAADLSSVGLRSTDGSEFVLNSFEIESGTGDYQITITGKRNGADVYSASLDLGLASSTHGGATFSGPWRGVISFTGWDAVDEIVITPTTAPVYNLDLDLDDIVVSPSVVINTLPTAANSSVSGSEDSDTLFSAADFPYVDTDGDPLAGVQITALPLAGRLRLSGADVALNQNIGKADIDAGRLTFTPAANANGSPYATFGFRVHDGIAYSVAAYTMTVNISAVNDAPTNTVLPVISGSATVGGTLSTSNGSWSDVDDDTLSYSYQWKRGTTNVGTNANSYTLTTADALAAITVVVTANDGNGGTTSATSAVTIVINTAPTNSALPVISGSATVGGTLSTTNGSWSDVDGDTLSYSYQWKRGTTNVGTNANSYTLTTADALADITVVVTANDGNGGTTSATSAVTIVINTAPTNSALPVISGSATVGGTLSTTNGSWSDVDGDTLSYSYQWKRGTTNVGTNANSYTLTTADALADITVVVTANDGNGGTTSATSAVTIVINTAPTNSALPVISGSATVGGTLSTTNGSWSDVDGDTLSYSYQWQSGGTRITGATAASYLLTSAEAHTAITVVVTANDGQGGVTTATSAGTTVTNTAPLNSVVPVISGTATVGGTLSTSNGSWSDADGDAPTYSYQWQSGGVAISGATSSTYLLTSAEAHSTITVVVTAHDGNTGSTAATSGEVTASNLAPVNTLLPAITGSALVGGTLSASHGSWFDADADLLTYSYQWQADGADIGGATSSSYTLGSAEFGKVLSVVVTAADGHGGSVSATSLATVAIDNDFDGDGIGDATDTDDDNDGMSDLWELAYGLNPLDAGDAATDLDGDGVSNLDESLADSDPTADDYPPVVTPPADVTVDAVGLLTPVTLGSATAVDALDGELSATSDATSHFAPGVYTVTWSAIDAAGNTGTATQTVNVNPQVSFSKDQTSAEGSTVTFSVILNGPAASYPVDVPYTVSGTAATDGSDHTLTEGVATIGSGTGVVVSFTTVDDGAGEGSETIVVTMGSPSNAVTGPVASHIITIVEGNVAPVVSMSAEQGMGGTLTVTLGDGPVQVFSDVADPNSGDLHSYDWSATDNALVDTDSATETFTFDPTGLSAGLYTLRLSVSDGTASDTAALALNVVATAPLLTTADSDSDGSDDQGEGYGDSDNDGVADYLDAIASGNVLQGEGGQSRRFLVESEPGLNLGLGRMAFLAGNGQVVVSMTEIGNGGAISDDATYFDYPAGLFDFVIGALPTAGQSVRVVMPQRVPVPGNPVYRKLMSAGWQEFVADANNSVASAAGEEGFCPPPGDEAYSAGLTEGDWCVQLTLEDGGPNDADGVANNRVVDPGGVATILATDVDVGVTSGGGSVAPWWLLLLTLMGMVRLTAMRRGRAGQ